MVAGHAMSAKAATVFADEATAMDSRSGREASAAAPNSGAQRRQTVQATAAGRAALLTSHSLNGTRFHVVLSLAWLNLKIGLIEIRLALREGMEQEALVTAAD